MVGYSHSRTLFSLTMVMVYSALFFLLSGCAQEYEGSYDRFETCLESIDLEYSKFNIYPILFSSGLFPTFICQSGDRTYCVYIERTNEGKCLRRYSYVYATKRPRKPAQ
jgi:hypothetical protein